MFSDDDKLVALLRAGRNFSGRERHCAFLNPGDGSRFADISSLAGLDLPEDGTGVGFSDWDHDGDLDLWISNRSAPAVRFFENRQDSARSLQVVLVGVAANRDALGARVAVSLSDGRTLTKTLRAGDGYLSQSSKVMHFGLGEEATVSRVQVRWPVRGGESVSFSGIAADGGRFVLRQGSGKAVFADSQSSPQKLVKRDREEREESAEHQVVLAMPLPLPALEFVGKDGTRQAVFLADGKRSVILSLWASWCAPCLSELKEVASQRESLAAGGIDFLPVSVDGLTSDVGGDRAKAERFLAMLGWEGRSGYADERLMNLLQLTNDELFVARRALPLPASFLIDPHGRLVAIYKGPVDLNDAGQQLERLAMPFKERRELVQPFSGRWMAPPMNFVMLNYVYRLFRRGYLREGSDYLARYRRFMKGQRLFPVVLTAAGREMIAGGDPAGGAAQLREVLAMDPRNVGALTELSMVILNHRILGEPKEALSFARQAVQTSRHGDQSALLALAAAAEKTGHPKEAAEAREDARKLERQP